MRVLFVSPSASLGGAERVLIEAFRALRSVAPDWSLGLVVPADGPLVPHATAAGVATTVLPLPPVFAATGESGRSAVVTWLRLLASAPGLSGYVSRLRGLIHDWSPNVVHANGIKAHLLSARAVNGRPLVWHVHDYLSARRVSGALLRSQAHRAALAIANSRSVALDVSIALAGRLPVETVYSAIDPARFSTEGGTLDLDAAAGMDAAPAGTLRVGLVATFARWKGHEVFLQALASLPPSMPVRGFIVGGPVYQTGATSQITTEELRRRVDRLGLAGRVGFTGFVDDTAAAYRALDIVVHASTSPEPFGLAIAEAMACGRPVVISDAGGAREIAEPGRTCLAHSPGDVPALARAIATLAEDPGLRTTIGAAGASSVLERFTTEAMGEQLRAAYQAATNRRQDARP
jgi:glycosyltransferase involved in cell wall biosynthesis